MNRIAAASLLLLGIAPAMALAQQRSSDGPQYRLAAWSLNTSRAADPQIVPESVVPAEQVSSMQYGSYASSMTNMSGSAYTASPPGGWSVWPGVPVCCDPWLGYCQEHRCYPCWRGQARYLHYEPRGGCSSCGCDSGVIISWGGKKQHCATCPGNVPQGNFTSYSESPQVHPLVPSSETPSYDSPGTFQDSPSVQQAPILRQPEPPRNALPQRSARRVLTSN